jgi:hypothetical protein
MRLVILCKDQKLRQKLLTRGLRDTPKSLACERVNVILLSVIMYSHLFLYHIILVCVIMAGYLGKYYNSMLEGLRLGKCCGWGQNRVTISFSPCMLGPDFPRYLHYTKVPQTQ